MAKKSAIVLGAELAAAEEAEQQHRATQRAKSPMPKRGYDYWRGEMDLVNPTRILLDARIAALCRKYAKAAKPVRQAMRDAIGMGEFYTLLMFAQRAAVFAMRRKSVSWVDAALTALAMIEKKRVDWRDMLVAMGVVHHGAERIGLDAGKHFRHAARLAEPGTARLILGFVNRSASDKHLRSWGYQEIETDDGVGLVQGSGGTSSSKLCSVVFEMAAIFARDKYHPEVELNMGIPRIWLQSVDDRTLDRALAHTCEGACIRLRLRPQWHPDPFTQHVEVFLERMKSPEQAQRLAELAKDRHRTARTYHAVILAEGCYFCLLVARSWQEGTKSYESQKSVKRFAGPLAQVLRRHAQ